MSKLSIRIKITFLLLVNFLFVKVYSQETPCIFKFALSKQLTTSAGVYSSNGVLVRTLWNNKLLEKGEHSYQWDRKDDAGIVLQDTGYQVRVLTNSIQVVWEGVIGNNSDSLTGSSKIRAFERMNSMVVFGNYAYFSTGYAEGAPSTFKLDIRHPRNKINILSNEHNNVDLQCEYVATDGELVYWTGYDPFNTNTSFTFATKVADDLEYSFDKGFSQSTYYGRTYISAIDLIQNNNLGHPSGIAVQKNGPFLFIAHKDLDLINVINKKTGELIKAISIDSPREISLDNDGNIWIVSGADELCKYPISNDGDIGVSALCLNGLQEPLALAISPNGKTIRVIDGGNSQQIKTYQTSDGRYLFAQGEPGAYAHSTLVDDNRFYFNDSVTELTKPFLAFQSDSLIWIGDVGNERVLLFNQDLTCVNRISCLPHSYSIVVDRNDPTRVFNEYLEFKINYSKSLSPDNGSWELVRNWRHGIKPQYYESSKMRVFSQLITLDNGKTYAILDEYVNGIRKPEIVELPASGNIIYSGIKLKDFATDLFETNGDLAQVSIEPETGNKGYFLVSKLNGYINGWPNWLPADTIAIIPTILETDPSYRNYLAPVNNGFKYYIFQADKATNGYHLGAIEKHDSSYQFKTSKSTAYNYSGPMPSDGTFDIGNGVQYAGGGAYAIDNMLLWNYHGEFWKNSQTNIWNVFHEDGLMLLQFGITTPDGERISKEAFPMGAGNVFSSNIVKVGGTYYLYHNDESVHGGIHRWKISQTNSIQTIVIPLKLRPKASGGLKGQYYKGKTFNSIQLKAERIDPTIVQMKLPYQLSGSEDYSIRHSGYIQTDTSVQLNIRCQSGSNCRMSLNGVLTFDNSTMSQAQVTFNKRQPVRIILEHLNTDATLQWDLNGHWENIGTEYLIPDEFDIGSEVDLMEGLKPDTYLENGKFGWTILPEQQNDTLRIARTRIKYFENNRFDLYMLHLPDDSMFHIRRSLADIPLCEDAWILSGLINLDGSNPDIHPNGFNMLVMDKNNDTLFKMSYEYLPSFELNFPSTLKCNNEPYLFGSIENLNALLSKNNPFSIQFTPDGIQFSLGTMVAMSASYYSAIADWNNPSYIEFRFNKKDNQNKSISISELKLTGLAHIRIDNLGKDTLCTGEQVDIQTNSKLENLKWSNNALTQRITIDQEGIYYLKSVRNKGCTYQSDTFKLSVQNIKAVIIRKGDSLISESDGKEKWYIDGAYLDSGRSIKMDKTGVYKLICYSDNGCVDSVELNVSELDIKNIINSEGKIYPNPGHSEKPVFIKAEIGSRITIYTIEGKMYMDRKTEEAIEKVILEQGVYLIKIQNELESSVYKVIIL